MSFHLFYQNLKRRLVEQYPSTSKLAQDFALELLISPHVLHLPSSLVQKAERAIAALHRTSHIPEYRQQLQLDFPWLKKLRDNQSLDSVLMAYDFHTTADGRCYLVEINTNASAFLVSHLLYQTHGWGMDWKGVDALLQLRDSFLSEAKAAGVSQIRSAVIADEDVAEQKMYLEFLMYQDLFRSWGWQAEVVEANSLTWKNQELATSLGQTVDLVYNRTTDFYLENPELAALKNAYVRGGTCLTPHPLTYWLLADKERLVEMSQAGFLEKCGVGQDDQEAIRSVLIPTYSLSDFGSSSEIWSQRKRLFFKPRRSHGGKSVYRGSSVSKKVFDRLLAEDILVQEYVPAQSWPVTDDDQHMENWKFDLRFFVYGAQIQLAVARSYQGQVTNFSTPYGGLTAVKFSEA